MGNIFSRTLSNVVEDVVLRIAKTIDTVSRAINRNLSSFSSFCFSKLFGYDVVIVDDAARSDMICGPGNVCLLPASKTQQRQLDKRRRSERRKRAEAAAMGRNMIEAHNKHLTAAKAKRSNSMSLDTPSMLGSSSSLDEKEAVRESLSHVAQAPPPRPAQERETAAEKSGGKLWVLGNIQPSGNESPQQQPYYDPQAIDPKTPMRHHLNPIHHITQLNRPSAQDQQDKAIDDKVLQRMLAQRHVANTVNIKQAIQPRRSSKSVHTLSASKSAPANGVLTPTLEHSSARVSHNTNEPVLLQPIAQRRPSGALSLVPPPLEGPFRHPFAASVPGSKQSRKDSTTTAPLCDPHSAALDDDDSHLFTSSPQELSLEEEEPIAPLSISRPSSGASNRFKGPMTRRSMDAGSIRSQRSDSIDAGIDVKSLATKAVKEGREKRGWKDEVNKVAMQRCLQQQQNEQLRRLSAASLGTNLRSASPGITTTGGMDKALHRVRTQDARVDRRGSSPALPKLATSQSMYSPHTSPRRAESPLQPRR